MCRVAIHSIIVQLIVCEHSLGVNYMDMMGAFRGALAWSSQRLQTHRSQRQSRRMQRPIDRQNDVFMVSYQHSAIADLS